MRVTHFVGDDCPGGHREMDNKEYCRKILNEGWKAVNENLAEMMSDSKERSAALFGAGVAFGTILKVMEEEVISKSQKKRIDSLQGKPLSP